MKFILLIVLLPLSIAKQYSPNWTDFDTRPLPEWYDKAKIGIVLHWGVFSVPSFGYNETEWFLSEYTGYQLESDKEDHYVETDNKYNFKFFPVSGRSAQFKVRAGYDAEIVLTTTPEYSDSIPLYRIVIGGWSDTKCAIGNKQLAPIHIQVEIHNILSSKAFHGFWVSWDSGIISVGREGETVPFMSWSDPEPIPVAFVGVGTGPDSPGTWKINNVRGTKEVVDFMAKNYPPGFTYQEFAPKFTAEFFDANQWATLFSDSGAKYVVLSSKGREGYALFPSKRSFSYNSAEVGPHRDIVGELSKSVRNNGNMKFGVYYFLYERTLLFKEDQYANFGTRKFVDHKLRPEMEQLINDYEPSILWVGIFKIDGKFPNAWNITELLAWVYNDSPVKNEIVTNDQWNGDCIGAHGDVYDYDPYNKVADHKYENKIKLDRKSYGYRRNALLDEIITFDDLLFEVVSTVSYGGNAAIHISATKEGSIPPIYQERLLALGNWLKINGEAIYESSPWFHQNDRTNKDVWYTCRKEKYNATNPTAKPSTSDTVTAIYAILLKWPKGGKVPLQKEVMSLPLCDNYEVKLLGNDDNIEWSVKNGPAMILLPDITTVASTNAWTFKFTPKPKTRRQQPVRSAAEWCNRRRSSRLHRARRPNFVDIEKPKTRFHNISSTYRKSIFFSN